jgi:hypothetical protein
MLDRFHVGLYDKNLLTGHEDIEPDVIDILTRMTQDFVSDVIYRVVVLSEARRRMRGSTKVRHQDEVSIAPDQSFLHSLPCYHHRGTPGLSASRSFNSVWTPLDLGCEPGNSLSRTGSPVLTSGTRTARV